MNGGVFTVFILFGFSIFSKACEGHFAPEIEAARLRVHFYFVFLLAIFEDELFEYFAGTLCCTNLHALDAT